MYIHKGAFSQRGRGLGNIFGSLMRAVIPLGKSIFRSPITKSILNSVKDSAIQGGVSVASDALRGGDVKESLKKNLGNARDRLANTLDSNFQTGKRSKKRGKGGGKKKKRRQLTDLLA